MKTFTVSARALNHNGKTYEVGDSISLPKEDGEILKNAGRVKDPTPATTASASKKD